MHRLCSLAAGESLPVVTEQVPLADDDERDQQHHKKPQPDLDYTNRQDHAAPGGTAARV